MFVTCIAVKPGYEVRVLNAFLRGTVLHRSLWESRHFISQAPCRRFQQEHLVVRLEWEPNQVLSRKPHST